MASWVWFDTLAFYRGVMPASHRAVTRRRLALCALGALGVSACSDASQTGPDVTLAVATSTTAAPRAADGTLRIATVMPMTGGGARLGVPLAAAVASAIEEINLGGGVLGRTVDLVQFDEVTTA
ncbi:MAG: ABC transporter substrate-binding protein, partial [Actinobacteria bacterium]|nr:ABC transporter substrate-binding protein [Actinomycetota bacterium]